MYRKDQIKGIIALILFACIGLSYFFLGDDATKYVTVLAIFIWLGSMYYLNRKSPED